MNTTIDVFSIQQDIVNDYKRFVESFIKVRDKYIEKEVNVGILEGKYWPEPLIRFNPSFEKGEPIEQLCDMGILHPCMADIFRGIQLYRHQVEAIKLGCKGKDFIVTSGTGSGKSLTFLATIFDYLLREKKDKGIKAIIVYPMNALINSQYKEIEKYKDAYETRTGKPFPIDFAQYTGQEKEEKRDKVRNCLPDIILTNYMMLEYLLTRPNDYRLRDSIYRNLKFLVFDELHMYRGSQGTDVALLVSRIKAQVKQEICCIGTSATMISGGTIEEQKKTVARVARKLLGGKFETSRIIGEYLTRCFDYNGSLPSQEELKAAVEAKINVEHGEEKLKAFALGSWIENRVALEEKEGILVRKHPLRFNDMADMLARDSGMSQERCNAQLLDYLKWLANVNETIANKRGFYLPYKIHQFISQTGAVFASLHNGKERLINLDPVSYKMMGSERIPLFPVVFSRESGQEFYCVTKDEEKWELKPRDFKELEDEEEKKVAGYLIPSPEVWDPENDLDLLPESWLNRDKSGNIRVDKNFRDRMPKRIYYDHRGRFSDDEPFIDGFEGWFMSAKLLFDPTSGIIFNARTSEGTKLTRLGSEGRSTSTTVLALSMLKQMAKWGVSPKEQKVLSFTDNRQDAALQAGHFNDFINAAQLRSAIYRALETHGTLDHSGLGEAIFEALGLQQEEYALNPSSFHEQERDNRKAFIDFLMYRALYDLRHSWRVILPNLEQCGLLEIGYKYLKSICNEDKRWANVPFINTLLPIEREDIIYHVLDYARKSYALHSEEYLTERAISTKERTIKERLKEPWKFSGNENIFLPNRLYYKTLKKKGFKRLFASIGPLSTLGKYLKKEAKSKEIDLSGKDYMDFIEKLMMVMEESGWLKGVKLDASDGEETWVYSLRIDQITWSLGKGEQVKLDPVRRRSYKNGQNNDKNTPNLYFRELYKVDFTGMKRFTGAEHTGQLENEDRGPREEEFRSGQISALFCSPTMELGIDIDTLNMVHMRNVPPNPANYAQRGGRAGRSGKAALVFTSCSTMSPHDRHYFKNQQDMVSGVVAPPTLNLDNRDMLLAHLNALFISKVGLYELTDSIKKLIDSSDKDALPLTQKVKEMLKLEGKAKVEVKHVFREIAQDIRDRCGIDLYWLTDEWIDAQLDGAPAAFDRTLDKWRRYYKDAERMIREASEIINEGLYPARSKEMREAKRKQAQALHRRSILCNERGADGKTKGRSLSEFYPYRYLAAEGFLPGYNFVRLPVRAFIPHRDGDQFIVRPRLIAIREFAPGNIIYHKGAKFKVTKMEVPEMEKHLKRAKVARASGYIMMDSEYDLDNCPFTNASLTEGSSKIIFTDLLALSESETEEIDRITFEEEERLSRGYDIETFFSVPGGMETVKQAKVTHNGKGLLNMSYIPAARLVQVNQKWRSSLQEGFIIGTRSGRWLSASQIEKNPPDEEIRTVRLYTWASGDALYVEPIKALELSSAGVITLMYALKRAIENIFQVEERELGVELVGDKARHPNMLFYEASEGCLGLLPQFLENETIFERVVAEAYRLCRFSETDYRDPASYDDLLNFYNQRYHEVIDRFAIKRSLEMLKSCKVELCEKTDQMNYDEHYRRLKDQIDPKSSTERRFLDVLHRRGLRLPDGAQQVTSEVYCRPDFFYSPDIHVFCDGTPHDDPEVQALDKKLRNALRNAGFQVLVWHYSQDLEDFLKKRPDVFKPVR